MSKYKKDEKVLISAQMFMSCWIPREMYEEIRDVASDGDGGYDSINIGRAETRYIFNHGWLNDDGYVTSDEIEDIEDSEKTDWEQYEIDEEEHLDTSVKRDLEKLRRMIGEEDKVHVGNQGGYSDFVIFVDEEVYSNSLTYAEAKDEIDCLLTGIKLGARKKEE